MASSGVNIYAAGKLELITGAIVLVSDTLVALLVSPSYTPQLPTDSTYANVSAYEISGTGYTTGGQVVSAAGVTYLLAGLAIASGGTAYAQSDVGKVVTVSGGTSTTAATVTITQVNGGTGTGAVTAASVAGGGIYTVPAANPQATSGGGTTGSGLTLTGVWGVQFAANNPSWTSSTITAKYLVICQRAGGTIASTDKLLGYVDLNTATTSSTISSTNGPFSVMFSGGASAGNIFSFA